ncbi:NtaA/DmoA family FMN-dependent monooxygenase [Rhodococcus erythropolis]|uniref:NtaA/DmoA family FMN-dependent monooxygenase n=1 Tax=Rhodococcus erythropolis TaxID=1833 RepID=UPI001BEB3839|nr:NtaA/DmoA family FMN-dependent monooxygenase [Rhodococcus erythropolis]MBT2263407.1 NtaA/DmoA family FMN-dependent monooxygenase [Rhodococcus erythropolis]
MSRSTRVHLAAHLPGVDSTVVWSDPRSRSQTEFETFENLARSAERGLFDFLFLAEGLRLREFNGKIYENHVVGRPDSLVYLAAISAVTSRLGLAATVNTTYNEPYDLARKLATLDHVSGGRAAWNVVTTNDAFTGANFTRGGFLPDSARYERAREFLALTHDLWRSWSSDPLAPDPSRGWFTDSSSGVYSHRGQHFDVAGRFNVPTSPQTSPVIIQAGDSEEGRELAAETADIVFSKHTAPTPGRIFYQDIKNRLARFDRTRESLLVFTRASVVLGDSSADAQSRSTYLQQQQISPASALATLGGILGLDLSDHDPFGPPPPLDSSYRQVAAQGHTLIKTSGRADTVLRLHRLHESNPGSIVDLMRRFADPHTFVGTPRQVAHQIAEYVHTDVADGIIVDPAIVPESVADLVDRVVPELQDLGVYPDRYHGETLRESLFPDDQGQAPCTSQLP